MASPSNRISSGTQRAAGVGAMRRSDKQIQLDGATVPALQQLTTSAGVGLTDNHNSLRAGNPGPSLLEDFVLREKLTHFAQERIPERVVSARGCAAHGYFKVYKPLAHYTSACFLQDPEIETPVFVRFSTLNSAQGSADTVRDVRGFAVKFYTQEGNYDLVGANMPVFYIQDAMKFPDLMHALKPEPNHEMPQATSAHDTFWDFASLMPEMTHMLMWTMSDRGIPRSLRMMDGFGVHAFRFINAHGNAFLVKFHWKPKLGVHGLLWDEAQKIAGKDPDFHRRDLWEAIDSGCFPEWELGVQILDAGQENDLKFNILDPTKLIPESQVAVQIIGKLVLNRNVENYFAETEQVAFNPGNLIPGIDFSDDPVLQGRLMAYSSAQCSRLSGANFQQIPINASVCPLHNFQRGGSHQQVIHKGRAAYEPNTLNQGAEFRIDGGANSEPSAAPVNVGGKTRQRPPSFDDHFSQAALFWSNQSFAEKEHITDAFRYELSQVTVSDIQQRMVDSLAHVDAKLALRIASWLGISPPDAKAASGRLGFRESIPHDEYSEDPSLPAATRLGAGIKSRKIAFLIADGVDAPPLRRLVADLTEAGAVCKLVAMQPGRITTAGGRQLAADHTFANMPSIMFDAVVIPGGIACASALRGSGEAVHFVLETYKYCKTICAINEGAELLATLGFDKSKNLDVIDLPAAGVMVMDLRKVLDGQASHDLVVAIGQHRHWDRPNTDAVPA